MDGVSGRAVAFALDGAARRGIDPNELIAGLGLTFEEACRPGGRVPWESLSTICRRLGDAVGGPDGLRKFGKDNASNDSMRIFRRVGRALSHPDDLYRMGVRWMGPALLPMITARIEQIPGGRLRETLTLAPEFPDCPEVFHLMHGVLEGMPKVYGHEESIVDLELHPHRAIMTIQPRSSSSGWLGRSIRAIHRRLSFRSMLREIEEQQASIHQTYWEMRDARDRIERQAGQLERVNTIGRQLSQHIELDRVADVLVSTLIDSLDMKGVELRLIPSRVDEALEPRFFRSEGETTGEPTAIYPLASAGHEVGTLIVWRPAAPGPSRPDAPPLPANESAEVTIGPRAFTEADWSAALLERLVPWISMALDNARIHAELQSHAADLEHRVKERTARLLAANHHLVREIEERKRATDALLESEAQLRASERLASVGTLAAGIAHEINNPIGSILAAAQFAKVLEHQTGTREEVSRALSDIEMEAKRCGGIVRSVLQFSRDERTEKWDCRLDEILQRSIRLYTTRLGSDRDLDLSVDLPTGPIWVHVNPIQIEQAIFNLISNAFEAGSTRVRVRCEERVDERIALVRVLDNGPGIPEDDRLRIFEPFYTTRRADGGTGLGLSVVHGIAAEHSGALKIETGDQAGHETGTSALLELPSISVPAAPYEEKREVPELETPLEGQHLDPT